MILIILILFSFNCYASEEEQIGNYKEIYNPLVQAVAEGNLIKFLENFKAYDPKIRLAYGYNLRHLAWHAAIDCMLEELGVASKQAKKVTRIAPELSYRYGGDSEKILKMYECLKKNLALHILYPQESKNMLDGVVITIERDPAGRDIYDKFPEDYSDLERAELARRLRTGIHVPLKKD